MWVTAFGCPYLHSTNREIKIMSLLPSAHSSSIILSVLAQLDEGHDNDEHIVYNHEGIGIEIIFTDEETETGAILINSEHVGCSITSPDLFHSLQAALADLYKLDFDVILYTVSGDPIEYVGDLDGDYSDLYDIIGGAEDDSAQHDRGIYGQEGGVLCQPDDFMSDETVALRRANYVRASSEYMRVVIIALREMKERLNEANVFSTNSYTIDDVTVNIITGVDFEDVDPDDDCDDDCDNDCDNDDENHPSDTMT